MAAFTIREILDEPRVTKAFASAGREYFNVQSLRQSAATYMLEDGVELDTVQMILGHADIETTRIYSKATIERRVKSSDKIKAL